MAQIEYTITDTQLIQNFGPDAVQIIADKNRYFEQVSNPYHVPAQGPATIPDSNWTAGEGETEADRPTIDNIAYVEAVGEPFMANPESRLHFIARRIIEIGMSEMAKPVRESYKLQAAQQVDADFANKLQSVIDGVNINVTE